MQRLFSFRCFLMGSKSRLIRCGDILLDRGHQILGVISEETAIQRWVREKSLHLITPSSDLASVLRREPFDLFLSIDNDFIVANEILTLPQQVPINFHDGPLPKYAGPNATNWAIMNREATHGITWHAMLGRVDSGDILKQVLFPVSAEETAFTLNAKCYEKSVEAFRELVDELAEDRVTRVKQDLKDRTYFGRWKRPPACCTIDWSNSAEDIDALFRGLDHGSYPNPLGLPKLYLGDRAVVVKEARILGSKAREAPGTIIFADAEFLRVATKTSDIELRGFISFEGDSLSPALLLSESGIGDQLPSLVQESVDLITKIHSELCRHEDFWSDRLLSLDPIEIPYAKRQASRKKRRYIEAYFPILTSALLGSDISKNAGDSILAAAMLYFYLIANKPAIDIDFQSLALRKSISGAEAFFATHVPIRVEVQQQKGFSEFFAGIADQIENVRIHGSYARDLPLREPSLRGSLIQRGPLFAPVALERVEELAGQKQNTCADLVIVVPDDGKGCVWRYDAEVFDRETIDSMAKQFGALLNGLVDESNPPVAELSILPEHERHKVLVKWNGAKVDYPEAMLLHHLFEAQVERTPDCVAVEFEGRRLSYSELNRHANKLASRLMALGVKPDSLVGVCMERSLEMVLALYGILKAGGAYVPIDPEYPQERIEYMLQDSGFSVLLSQTRLIGQLHCHNSRIICLDDDWGEIGGEDTVNTSASVIPRNLAYMIYTSGSTGKPKGAMNTHRGICNRLLWMQDQYRLTKADLVLQKTPFSFDVSVWEFFWPLLSGARLVVARPGGHRDAAYLVNLIIEKQITVLHFVPSMLRAFLEEPGVEKCQSLRHVICSGEALPYDLQERFFRLLPAQLHNLYGPTEAAVDVTHWTCRRNDERKIVPIGRPVANTRIYILDRYLKPTPVGVPGELHIGGVQVGRGYHNRPELTAEKFIPDPYYEDGKALLYKTGDLCRWLPDGAIEYLERTDFQVKIRGFRIELGEIENALRQHPAVRETVVMAREDTQDDKRLIAYIVPNREYNIGSPQDELHPEQLQDWQTIFDEMYRQSTDVPDPTFNTVGWNSSYTGEAIPVEEMRTWVDSTVARILALRPQNVWEIGCGTGLLLHRLAPHCANYLGTDSSASVVEHLQRQISAWGSISSNAVVRQASAHDFSGVAADAFDVVILNSVTQYFPSVRYLVGVLEGVVQAVKPGGAIFLGDIRSQPLLEAFHASVQLHCAPSSLLCNKLRQKIQTALAEESELTISPEFFSALQKHLSAISQVEIQLKRGHHRNELNLFRYDVILRVKNEIMSAPNSTRLNWREGGLTLSDLCHCLAEQRPEALIVTQVPNKRLARELKTLQILAAAECPKTAGELREMLRTEAKLIRDVDPEDLWSLGESLEYDVQVRWSKGDAIGSYDVIFIPKIKQAREEDKPNPLFDFGEPANTTAPWHTYGNNPLHSMMMRDIGSQLRSHLKKSLPDFMIPAAFVILERLPLMPNGKLDQRALPSPDADELFGDRATGSMPEEGAEKKIAEIWREVLGIERVGRDDSFFDRGGDSLRLTMVRRRLQQVFNREIDLVDLFKFPTVRVLAQHLSNKKDEASPLHKITDDESSVRKSATRLQGQRRKSVLDKTRIH